MGAPSHGDQVPPLDEDMNDDQAPIDLPLADGAIRVALFKMDQAITTQTHAATTQAQAMTAQDNRILYPKQTNKFLPCPIV